MSTPQHAIDAANEIGAQLNSWLRDWTSADITNEAFAAIIAAHPDPELARLREELHIRNAELKTVCEYKDEYAKIAKRNEDKNTQLRARVAELESQLNDAREYGARMQRERDDRKWQAKTWEEVAGQHCADAAKLEQQLHALRLVCGTTDANKFETALDRANAKIKELEARKEASQ